MRLFALYGFLTLTLLAQVPGVVNTNRGMIPPSNGVRYGNILFPGGIPPGTNTHAGRLGARLLAVPIPVLRPEFRTLDRGPSSFLTPIRSITAAGTGTIIRRSSNPRT